MYIIIPIRHSEREVKIENIAKKLIKTANINAIIVYLILQTNMLLLDIIFRFKIITLNIKIKILQKHLVYNIFNNYND